MILPCSAALNASGAGNPYTIGTASPDLHFGQMRELPRFFALRAPIDFLPRSDGRYVPSYQDLRPRYYLPPRTIPLRSHLVVQRARSPWFLQDRPSRLLFATLHAAHEPRG